VPFHAADEIVTSAVEADRVAVSDELLPTFTLPKFSVAGETASVPGVGFGLGGGFWT
jgi:hypothetical protein